ncbi:MAG TPA: SGNH/GDSL hydrolase family protein [Candidatus Limnocylindrales bacterium]|nr:SGNH/GDSL hydrolase family protein [Candidatus Limnocylindrales bacterium]
MTLRKMMARILAGVGLAMILFNAGSMSAGRAAQLQAGDTVAICGDSITEQREYSVFIEDYLLMCQPVPDLKAHQFGWSGEKTDGLLRRMRTEILPFNPTVATTCYGMNDGAYTAIDPARQEAYRKNTEAIIKICRAGGVHFIVIGSPGLVDTYTFDRIPGRNYSATNYNNTLADLARIAREVAAEQGVTYADVYTPMAAVMKAAKAKYGPAYDLAGPDGIHPEANGHLVMAYAFLKALGCSGDIGTITWDARTGRATATTGHRILSVRDGNIKIESTRYPFCFYGNPIDPNSTKGVLQFLPFNEDLNRFRLVVTNSGANRFKVTWGKESKVFSAADLKQGVNLAAEFLDNPFAEAFASVDEVVREQQAFETPAVKSILYNLPEWNALLPEETATLDHLKRATIRKDEALSRASHAAVVPFKYTIHIEPIADDSMKKRTLQTNA